MFGHVQLRGAAVSPLGRQLGTPGSCPGPSSGLRPPAAEQGLGPGGLRWERHIFALSALFTKRSHQVECGRGLRVHLFAARSENRDPLLVQAAYS